MDTIRMILVRFVALLLVFSATMISTAGVALLWESWRQRNRWRSERIVHVPCRLCEPPGTGRFMQGECPLCDGESSIILTMGEEDDPG